MDTDRLSWDGAKFINGLRACIAFINSALCAFLDIDDDRERELFPAGPGEALEGRVGRQSQCGSSPPDTFMLSAVM